jgi:hypothetical protein
VEEKPPQQKPNGTVFLKREAMVCENKLSADRMR